MAEAAAHAPAHGHDAHHDAHHDEGYPPGILTPGKLCMWLFLGSDAMGFAAFVTAYVVLRAASQEWIPKGLPPPPVAISGLITFILIVSSVTMVYAYAAACRGDKAGVTKWIGATALGGIVFLCGQYYEWSHLIHEGLTPQSSPYGATFFACTGYHGLHVTIGVIYLLVMFWRSLKGEFDEKNTSEIEILGLYWHFVDLVWILLFTVIYLV